MLTLFPAIKPYTQHMYQVATLNDRKAHYLHIRQFGNEKGIPVVVHHGGPGIGCANDYARYFDPQKYRIILYDQRGAGLSEPKACIEDNNAKVVVEDIKTIMRHLGISKAVMFGGAWGATLSILFAELHPEMVLGLVLHGIFIGREQDICAFLTDDCAAAKDHPKEWQALKALVPENARGDFRSFISALHNNILDEGNWRKTAIEFTNWEILNSVKTEAKLEEATLENAAAMGRLNIKFMFDNFSNLTGQNLLNTTTKITELPIHIIHGNHDKICPIEQTNAFINALGGEDKPNIHINRTKGEHGAMDPHNIDGLIQATNALARQLTPEKQKPLSAGHPSLRMFTTPKNAQKRTYIETETETETNTASCKRPTSSN